MFHAVLVSNCEHSVHFKINNYHRYLDESTLVNSRPNCALLVLNCRRNTKVTITATISPNVIVATLTITPANSDACYFMINVLPRCEWQTAISQSACADETGTPNGPGWSYEREKRSEHVDSSRPRLNWRNNSLPWRHADYQFKKKSGEVTTYIHHSHHFLDK